MSSQRTPNYPSQLEAGLDCLINMHVEASHTYFSLGFYFVRYHVCLDDVGVFFQELAERKYDGARRLVMRSQRRGRSLYPLGQGMLQEASRSCLDALESALALEKSLNQALLDLYGLAWANSDHLLCEFLVRYFLEDEKKVLQKMNDHLTHLRQQVSSAEEALSKCLSKLSLNRD